jgi:hypothetical protein
MPYIAGGTSANGSGGWNMFEYYFTANSLCPGGLPQTEASGIRQQIGGTFTLIDATNSNSDAFGIPSCFNDAPGGATITGADYVYSLFDNGSKWNVKSYGS